MKKLLLYLCCISIWVTYFHLFIKDNPNAQKLPTYFVSQPVEAVESEVKQVAFQILRAKCNACHKKKNPFKIFSLKNMNRHAKKIHKQVFVYRRMPKGDSVKLTKTEYQALRNWLNETLSR